MNTINWQTKALKRMRKIPAPAGKAIRTAVSDELSDLNQARNVKKLTHHAYVSHPGRLYGLLTNKSGRETYHSFMACMGVLLLRADWGSCWLYNVT